MRLVICLFCAIVFAQSVRAEDWQVPRSALVEEIRADVRRTRIYTGRAALDEQMMAAMERVPRHEFVDPHLWRDAYENRPLPIGHGQTISQPYIVAYMTEALRLPPNAKVLDVGKGSGYQAAVLAEVAREVFSIEILSELADSAATKLEQLGYENIHVP